MNKVIISGRLTKEPELKVLSTGTSTATFIVAVDRLYKDKNGNKETDFFNCVAWKGKAEFIKNYVGKGRLVLITGEINNRKWQKQDGTWSYITEILVETIEALDKKQQAYSNETTEDFHQPVSMKRTGTLNPISTYIPEKNQPEYDPFAEGGEE